MKDNKLIAEFMGVGKHYEAQSSNQFNQYHKSWDRLMPVMAELVKNFGSGWIFEEGYDLNTRYNAVVEFIKQRERINPKTGKIDEKQNHVMGGVDFSESIKQLNNLL